MNKDDYKVIRAGGVTIAQGWQCANCKLVRPYYMERCPCALRIVGGGENEEKG